MVQIIIATTTERKTVLVEEGTTYRQVITDNGFDTVGMTYHINGIPVGNLDDVAETGTLVAVPAQKAGC